METFALSHDGYKSTLVSRAPGVAPGLHFPSNHLLFINVATNTPLMPFHSISKIYECRQKKRMRPLRVRLSE